MTLQFRAKLSILFLLLCPALTVPVRAAFDQTTGLAAPQKSPQQLVQSLTDEFSRREKRRDCDGLNKLTGAYLKRTDEAGDIARKYALTALARPANRPEKKGKGCRYSDKRAAFHIAVEMFRASAQLDNWSTRRSKHILSTLLLETSLGKTWRKRLAKAGIAAAMQKLVVLNLTCQKNKPGDINAFWAWTMTDAGKKKRDPTFEGLLHILSRSQDCKSLAEPARIGQACYWNERQSRLFLRSHEIVVTDLMLGIRNDILQLAKANGMLDSLSNHCKPTDIRCFNMSFQKRLQDLISRGCKAILPASVHATLIKQAGTTRPDTLENLSRSLEPN